MQHTYRKIQQQNKKKLTNVCLSGFLSSSFAVINYYLLASSFNFLPTCHLERLKIDNFNYVKYITGLKFLKKKAIVRGLSALSASRLCLWQDSHGDSTLVAYDTCWLFSLKRVSWSQGCTWDLLIKGESDSWFCFLLHIRSLISNFQIPNPTKWVSITWLKVWHHFRNTACCTEKF